MISTDRGLCGGSTAICSASRSPRFASGSGETWGGAGGHRPEGGEFLPVASRSRWSVRSAISGEAPDREADRRAQGDARCLRRGAHRPRVPRLQRLREHHDPAADGDPAPAAAAERGHPDHARLGLHLRARSADRARPGAHPLHRVVGLSGCAREPGERARGAHGGDESGVGQCHQADRRATTGLQQGPPGGDHPRDRGDRRRRVEPYEDGAMRRGSDFRSIHPSRSRAWAALRASVRRRSSPTA